MAAVPVTGPVKSPCACHRTKGVLPMYPARGRAQGRACICVHTDKDRHEQLCQSTGLLCRATFRQSSSTFPWPKGKRRHDDAAAAAPRSVSVATRGRTRRAARFCIRERSQWPFRVTRQPDMPFRLPPSTGEQSIARPCRRGRAHIAQDPRQSWSNLGIPNLGGGRQSTEAQVGLEHGRLGWTGQL